MLDTFRKRATEQPRGPTPGSTQPRVPIQQPQLRMPAPLKDASPGELQNSPPQPDQVKPAPALSELQPIVQPATRGTRESARLTVGPDIKLNGAEITDCDTLIVEGQVDACMDSRVIEVAEQGIFRGKVHVDVAEIRGRFEGELTANKQLMIRASGTVAGKIRYGKLLVDEGGEISGDIAAVESSAEIRSRTAPAGPAVGASDNPVEAPRLHNEMGSTSFRGDSRMPSSMPAKSPTI